MLFSRTWERKGKVQGIHSRFGELSFTQSNQIPNNYHCNQEDIVDIILELLSILENFDTL